MGIKDRKKRQLAEREQVFIDHAWAMIERDGVLNLQMARLAAECEYSVGTLYMHFASKEDLLLALATSTISRRLALFEKAQAWQAPSRHRMLAIVVADCLFARSSPQCYRLVQYVSTQTIWMAASEERRQAALRASEPLGLIVQNIVSAATESKDVQSHDLVGRELSVGLWAMTEGMQSLVSAAGLLETHTVDRPFSLLLRHAHALLNGLGWQPLMPLDDCASQDTLLEQILNDVFPDEPSISHLLINNSPSR